MDSSVYLIKHPYGVKKREEEWKQSESLPSCLSMKRCDKKRCLESLKEKMIEGLFAFGHSFYSDLGILALLASLFIANTSSF